MRNRHFKVFTLGPTFLILKETVFLSLCVCWGGGGVLQILSAAHRQSESEHPNECGDGNGKRQR